jgi:hypothetical protein
MTMLVADHERASGCPHFRIVNPYVRARTVFLLLLKLGSFPVLIRRRPSDAGPVPPLRCQAFRGPGHPLGILRGLRALKWFLKT